MSFSQDGVPIFGPKLASRPKTRGESYYHVLFDGTRPVRAALVVVVGENKADWSHPVATIFRWTGKGYDVGARFADQTFRNGCFPSKEWPTVAEMIVDGFFCAVVGVAGIAVATTGGFVVGSAISLPDVAIQLDRTLDPARERAVMQIRLSYDDLSRLQEYSFEIPGDPSSQRVVTSRCAYSGNRSVPIECTVDSVPDNVSRKLHPEI